VSRSGSLLSDQPGSGISVEILTLRGRSRAAACVCTSRFSSLGKAARFCSPSPYLDMRRQRACQTGKIGMARHAKEPQHVCSDPPVEKRIVRGKGHHTHTLTGPPGRGTRKSEVASEASFGEDLDLIPELLMGDDAGQEDERHAISRPGPYKSPTGWLWTSAH